MTEPSAIGSWSSIGPDGFVLAPPPLSVGRLLIVVGIAVSVLITLWSWWSSGPVDPNAVYVAGGLALLALLLLGAGVRQAAVRTTLTVRGNGLRIDRTIFGVPVPSYELPLGHVVVVPGKQLVRHGAELHTWMDLKTPRGTYRVGLGTHGSAEAEAVLTETVELLHLAKRQAVYLPKGEADPKAREALEALRQAPGQSE